MSSFRWCLTCVALLAYAFVFCFHSAACIYNSFRNKDSQLKTALVHVCCSVLSSSKRRTVIL